MTEQRPFALVVEGNDAVADYRVDRWIEKHGWEKNEFARAETFAQRAKPDLFGGRVLTALTLDSQDDVKRMVSVLKDAEKQGSYDFIGDGFIIIVRKITRRGTKALENAVQRAGGELLVSSAKDAVSTVSTMLAELHLQQEVKDFLQDHVGNSVEKLIPIMRTVHHLPPRAQGYVSLEDMLIRVSPSAGEIEPWGLEKAIMAGNTAESIRLLRRIVATSSPMFPLHILKSSLSVLHQVKCMVAVGVDDGKEVSSSLGISANQASYIIRYKAKKVSMQQTIQAVELVAYYESKMKGGEAIDPMMNMEVLVARLSRLFSR